MKNPDLRNFTAKRDLMKKLIEKFGLDYKNYRVKKFEIIEDKVVYKVA